MEPVLKFLSYVQSARNGKLSTYQFLSHSKALFLKYEASPELFQELEIFLPELYSVEHILTKNDSNSVKKPGCARTSISLSWTKTDAKYIAEVEELENESVQQQELMLDATPKKMLIRKSIFNEQPANQRSTQVLSSSISNCGDVGLPSVKQRISDDTSSLSICNPSQAHKSLENHMPATFASLPQEEIFDTYNYHLANYQLNESNQNTNMHEYGTECKSEVAGIELSGNLGTDDTIHNSHTSHNIDTEVSSSNYLNKRVSINCSTSFKKAKKRNGTNVKNKIFLDTHSGQSIMNIPHRTDFTGDQYSILSRKKHERIDLVDFGMKYKERMEKSVDIKKFGDLLSIKNVDSKAMTAMDSQASPVKYSNNMNNIINVMEGEIEEGYAMNSMSREFHTNNSSFLGLGEGFRKKSSEVELRSDHATIHNGQNSKIFLSHSSFKHHHNGKNPFKVLAGRMTKEALPKNSNEHSGKKLINGKRSKSNTSDISSLNKDIRKSKGLLKGSRNFVRNTTDKTKILEGHQVALTSAVNESSALARSMHYEYTKTASPWYLNPSSQFLSLPSFTDGSDSKTKHYDGIAVPEKGKNPFTHFCRMMKPKIAAELSNKCSTENLRDKVQDEIRSRWRGLKEERQYFVKQSMLDHSRYEREMQIHREVKDK